MSIQNAHIQQAAQSVGIILRKVKNGFYLVDVDDGEQLGCDDGELIHEPWPAESVLEYCRTLKEGNGSGVYLT